MNVLFVDLETDQLDKTEAKAIQVAFEVVLYPDEFEAEFCGEFSEGLRKCRSFKSSSIIDSETIMHSGAKAVHRVEQSELKGKPKFKEFTDFFEAIEFADYMVAHNGREFDFVILEREMKSSKRALYMIRNAKWFDTLVASRKIFAA